MANNFINAKIGGVPEVQDQGPANPMYYASLPDYVTAGMPQPQAQQAVNDPSFQPVPAMQFQQPATADDTKKRLPYAQQVAYNQAQAVSSGGAIPMATETQMQQKIIADPKIRSQISDAEWQQKEAARAQAEADAAQAEIRAIGYKKLSDDMEMKQAEYNKVMEEFKGQKLLDPQDKWGTAGKIGAAISMALGAFAATYSGGRNYAADIIDGAIKRDVDMQEAAIRKLGLDAQGAQNALATAYRKLGDMAQARNAVEMAALANVSDEIMTKASKADNQKVAANAASTKASIDQSIAQRAAQQNEITIATAGKPMTQSAEMTALQTPYGMAPSKDAANTVRQQAQEIDEARSGLSAFQEVMNKYGSWNLVPSEKKGEYQGALLPVINAYRVSLNMGVLNPSEREKIEGELKNKLSTKEASAFIGRMSKMIDSREQALQKAYIVGGGRPAQYDKTKAQLGFSK